MFQFQLHLFAVNFKFLDFFFFFMILNERKQIKCRDTKKRLCFQVFNPAQRCHQDTLQKSNGQAASLISLFESAGVGRAQYLVLPFVQTITLTPPMGYVSHRRAQLKLRRRVIKFAHNAYAEIELNKTELIYLEQYLFYSIVP